jgi:hypothetical protein
LDYFANERPDASSPVMKTNLFATLRRWFTGRRPNTHAPAALHNAVAHVLSLQYEDASGDADGLSSRFLIDAFIEPGDSTDTWEVSELSLLPPQAAELAERGEPANDLCHVLAVQILQGDHFQPIVEQSCFGACRVRLRVNVRNGLRFLRFRYRDALFGQVLLPASHFQAF